MTISLGLHKVLPPIIKGFGRVPDMYDPHSFRVRRLLSHIKLLVSLRQTGLKFRQAILAAKFLRISDLDLLSLSIISKHRCP